MKAGHGREALQILHGESQRTVHHPVDQETMLLGIDLRNVGTTGRPHEVERGWCDYAYRILKRRRHMKDEPEVIGRRPAAVGYAYRVDKTRADAVGDQILVALDHWGGCRCLTDRGCRCSQQTANQRGAFQEFSSTRSFRTHGSLLRMSLAENRIAEAYARLARIVKIIGMIGRWVEQGRPLLIDELLASVNEPTINGFIKLHKELDILASAAEC